MGEGRRFWRRCAPLLLGLGCGSVEDAQLPYTPGRVERVNRPAPFPRVAAQAITNVAIGPTGGGSCPIQLRLELPAPLEPSGQGPRVLDGEGASVQCVVRPLVDEPGTFEVDLAIEHEQLPRLRVSGTQSEAPSSSRVSLEVIAPDGADLDASCRSEVHTILDGAVWFTLADCSSNATSGVSSGCRIEVAAIFENCEG